MSILSSGVTSISSILKAPGARSAALGQNKKLCFKLPTNIREVLLNFTNDNEAYRKMVEILETSYIKDCELLKLLKHLHKSILMLSKGHKDLIKAVLNIDWTHRSDEITSSYKRFIEDLVSVHNVHLKTVISRLVRQFKHVEAGAGPWVNGTCPESYKTKMDHVHYLLKKFTHTHPMSNEDLVDSLHSFFPHSSEGLLVTEQYIFALFQVATYAPLTTTLRIDILCLVIKRLIVLDVSTPPSEIQLCEEDVSCDDDEDMDVMFELDDADNTNTNSSSNNKKQPNSSSSSPTEMKHPGARMLDSGMEQLLSYVHNCHSVEQRLQMDPLKGIYLDLRCAFERIILPTYGSRHVQFVMFYVCGLDRRLLEDFVSCLWTKVANPNTAPILRQTAVFYAASLLARATYATVGLIQGVLSKMSAWIHSYIASQHNLEYANSNIKVHTVFYAVCQAMFYLLAFRQKDLAQEKLNLLFLQGLNLNKIITCRLNPLRFCQPAVVQNFAAVARNYQLAYCYNIIERNSRSSLPILETSNHQLVNSHDAAFFPFDPYLLLLSGRRLAGSYNSSQSALNNTGCWDSGVVVPRNNKADCDEDDFMDESFSSPTKSSESHGLLDKFSYSTSPGFLCA